MSILRGIETQIFNPELAQISVQDKARLLAVLAAHLALDKPNMSNLLGEEFKKAMEFISQKAKDRLSINLLLSLTQAMGLDPEIKVDGEIGPAFWRGINNLRKAMHNQLGLRFRRA